MTKVWKNSRALALALIFGMSSLVHSQSEASIAVGPQYDTSHVYVSPADVDNFVKCFLGTFGGASTKQVVATVTPTPSSTTSQLVQTPNGTVSLFGFTTPIPYPFGAERTGLLVANIDDAVKRAQAAGAELVVATFPDPIGRDAVVRFPGGVMAQLYWHTKKPSYLAFELVPENRVYISRDGADAFLKSFIAFSEGHIVRDDTEGDGAEIGRGSYRFRRIVMESNFGKMVVFVTDGILPFPYGRETTGYEVIDLAATLKKASSLGATIVTLPIDANGRTSAIARFPGGYLAEIHSIDAPKR
jgi:predicted enzyme related to lactoylglutathione lyase